MSKEVKLKLSLDTLDANKKSQELYKNIQKIRELGKPSRGSKEVKSASYTRTEADSKDIRDLKNSIDKLGSIGKAVAAVAGAKYLHDSGQKARDYDRESARVFNRLNVYSNDFKRATNDSIQAGKKYGFTGSETRQAIDSLLNATGYKSAKELNKDTQASQGFERAYGVGLNEYADSFGRLVKQGGYKQGQVKDYQNLIAGTIKSQGLEGREKEQVRAINQLGDILTNTKLNVTSDDLKDLVGLQEGLARQNAALKGEKGAELIGKASNLMDPNNQTMMMLMGYDGKGGVQGYLEKVRQMEEGLTADNMGDLVKGLRSNFGAVDSPMARVMLGKQFGFKQKELDAFLGALGSGDYKLAADMTKQGQEATGQRISNYTGSSVYREDLYQAGKEEASTAVGHLYNTATSPFKSIFNSMTPVGKGLVGFGTATIGAGSIANLGGRFLSGGGNGQIFSGLGERLAGLGGKVSPFLGKAGAVAGKAGTVAGKVAPWIPAAVGVVTGGYKLANGDTVGGSESIGKGLGGTGGALAGAAIGSAILPGVGTAVGGLIGALAGDKLGGYGGRKVGESLTSPMGVNQVGLGAGALAFSSEKGRETEILSWKERLLKKEESVFDQVLGTKTTSKDKDDDNKSMLDILRDRQSTNNYSDLIDKALSTGSQSDIKAAADSIVGGSSGGVEPTGGDFLGKISAKYETGGKNGGLVSSGAGDHGGISYGLPQFSTTTGSAKAFVNNLKGTPYEKYFAGAGNPGSSSFGNAWKKAYADDPEGFTRAQQEYVYKTAVAPFIKRIKKNKGIDLNSTRALQELAFSTATQFGNGGLGERALGNISSGMSEQAIIQEVYRNKRDNVGSLFRSSSSGIRNSLKNNRFVTEEKDLLAMVGQSSIKGYELGTDRVPKNQLAFLHKDEAVLNRFDAKEYRGEKPGRSSTINLNVNITGSNAGPELTKMVEAAINQAIQAIKSREQVNLSQGFLRMQN